MPLVANQNPYLRGFGLKNMRFDIITIFPKIFDSYLNESILKRARARKLVTIHSHDMRKFSRDSHKKVDDKPYGGGAGMVLAAEPILKAAAAALKFKVRSSKLKVKKVKIILLSAKGKQFTQKMAYDWAKKYDQFILISGRYEGIDERVKTALRAEEISIGPYVLTDGDAAAMAIISAVVRLIPGVIKCESLAEESHWSNLLKKEKNASMKDAGLEYPHYTRPEVFEWQGKKYRAPKILLSGDHKKIESWRNKHRKSS